MPQLNPIARDKVIVTAGSLFFPGINTRAESDPGCSVLDILRFIKIPQRYYSYLSVWLDGVAVPESMWHRVKPKAGHILSVGMAPAGDMAGANGKDTLQLAIPVVLQVGLYAGALALGAPGIIAGLVMFGGGAIGTWIAQNLIKVPEPYTNPGFSTIVGARNQIRKYECIPRVYGRIRYAPPMAANPVTSIEDQDQYIRLLLTPGYGPLKVTGFRIGDYDIRGSRSSEVKIEHHTLWNDRDDIRLFSRDVNEATPLQKQLDYADEWGGATDVPAIRTSPTNPKVVTVFTPAGTTEIGLDFLFPEGLYKENNKEADSYPVNLMIRYRLKGSTGASSWMPFIPPENNPLLLNDLIDQSFIDWLNQLNDALSATIVTLEAIEGVTTATLDLINFTRPQVSSLNTGLTASIASGALTAAEIAAANTTQGYLGTLGTLIDAVDGTVGDLADGASEFNDTLSQVIFVLDMINDIDSLVQAVRNSEGPDIRTLPAWQRTLIYLFGVQSVFQAPPAGSFTTRTIGNSRAPLWRSVSWFVPPGAYEVQVRRVSKNKYKDPTIHSRVQLFTYRSITEDPAVSEAMRQKLAFVAMKIKRTDDWNNQIDQVTMLCESPLYWHDGTEWRGPSLLDDSGYEVSRNPAWQMCDILRGGAANEPITSDDDLDLVKIREFADWCNDNGYKCDIIFDKRVSAEDAMTTVCRCGKATPSKTGEGKYTVIIDKPQTTPVALITPRVCRNFVASKNMEEKPHALHVKFQNADKDYQEDEAYVYADGYGAEHGLTEPTNIKEVVMPGITSPTLVKHLGRYFLACSILRPEVFQVDLDFKYLVFERGDLVLLQHDVPLFGRGTARITGLEVIGTQTFITLDEHPTAWEWGAGASNAIRVQTAGNLMSDAPCIYDPSLDPDRVYIGEPYPTNWDGVAAGDLVAVGALDLETVECIVKGIAPGPDLTATVSLIEHAPEVHDADDDIPEYDSRITLPYHPELARPPRPEVLGVSAADSATGMQTDGTMAARILLSIRLPRGNTVSERVAAQNVKGVEVQYHRVLEKSLTSPWDSSAAELMPTFTRDLSNVYVDPVEKGVPYNVRVRSVTHIGIPSDWFMLFSITAVGKEGPPPDVQNLHWRKGILTWHCNIPTDHAGFEVRQVYGQGDWGWETATPIHDGRLFNSSFDVSDFEGGHRIFYVKAVDTSGNESVHAARLQINLGEIPVDFEVDRHHLGDLTFYNAVNMDTPTPGYPETVAGDKTGFYPDAGVATYRAGEPYYQTAYPEASICFAYDVAAIPDGLRIFPNVVAEALTSGTIPSWRLDWRNQKEYLWPDDLEKDLWPDSMEADFWPKSMAWEAYQGKIDVRYEDGEIDATWDGAYEFRFVVQPSNVQWGATTVELVVDVEEIIESATDLYVKNSGITILPLVKNFTTITSALVSISDSEDQNPDAYAIRKSISLTPTVGVGLYDSVGGRCDGYVDYTVIGY